MTENMSDFVLAGGVKDKIASLAKHLGIEEYSSCEAIVGHVFDEIMQISAMYGTGVAIGDIVDTSVDNDKYETLHFIMDMLLIQSMRANAARYGIITEFVIDLVQEEDEEEDE